jgi:hypothetical protein
VRKNILSLKFINLIHRLNKVYPGPFHTKALTSHNVEDWSNDNRTIKVNPLTEELKSVVSNKAKYCEQNFRTADRKLSAN